MYHSGLARRRHANQALTPQENSDPIRPLRVTTPAKAVQNTTGSANHVSRSMLNISPFYPSSLLAVISRVSCVPSETSSKEPRNQETDGELDGSEARCLRCLRDCRLPRDNGLGVQASRRYTTRAAHSTVIRTSGGFTSGAAIYRICPHGAHATAEP